MNKEKNEDKKIDKKLESPPIKPITVARNDFLNDIINLCNDSGLPLFVIENVLKDFIDEVKIAANRQFENDKKKYDIELLEFQKSLKEEKEVE